ncbi:3-methyladenine DNA glycosylase AlkD [Pedobacter sp. CG_S7]|uniref:DNA alkylation repair protein n=1 Tax=Pedobacter sp. CG_S7 TaxID=3143930 RepID=UPI00339B3C2C
MNIIIEIRKELKKNSDPAAVKSSQRFFKEELLLHGCKNTEVRAISKKYFKTVKDLPKEELFSLCEELWKSGYLEESIIACDWSYSLRKQFTPSDFIIFEKWVKTYVNNWASCDTFCNHTIGEFLILFPEYLPLLKKWAKSENRWMRRAAAVSLIVPARKGKFLEFIFQLADILLKDQDDLVQKGYGWMLKAASALHQEAVFNYVLKNKKEMPRTALRYAIEKMPADLKIKAMEK